MIFSSSSSLIDRMRSAFVITFGSKQFLCLPQHRSACWLCTKHPLPSAYCPPVPYSAVTVPATSSGPVALLSWLCQSKNIIIPCTPGCNNRLASSTTWTANTCIPCTAHGRWSGLRTEKHIQRACIPGKIQASPVLPASPAIYMLSVPTILFHTSLDILLNLQK